MKNLKLQDKIFFDSAFVSIMQGFLSCDYFLNDKSNTEYLTTNAKNIALEMLKQRNELFGVDKQNLKEKTKTQKLFDVDFEQIMNYFNSVCISSPKITRITENRQKAIYKILEKYTLDDISKVFNIVPTCNSLSGRTKMNWKADFDWILKEDNFINIIEGKFKNVNGNTEKSNTEIFKSAVESEAGKNFRFVSSNSQ